MYSSQKPLHLTHILMLFKVCFGALWIRVSGFRSEEDVYCF